ncbi:MAG: hypothetical protein QXR53_02285 [Candidatus Norongarragalinales archaeon]
MKKIFSQFLVIMAALMFTLAVYQANQYMQVSAALGPSIAQLNQLDALGGEALGVDASQIESTKQLLSGTTNSLMQSILLDFVLGIVFLLAGYFTYNYKE